jgi:hypothetical protein
MQELRVHPWVTPAGMDPPISIPATMTGKVNLSSAISGINADQNSMTLTTQHYSTISERKLAMLVRPKSFKNRQYVEQSHSQREMKPSVSLGQQKIEMPTVSENYQLNSSGSSVSSSVKISSESSADSSNTPRFYFQLPLPTSFTPRVENFAPAIETSLTSDDMISKWHSIHRPPKEIRTFKFSINPNAISSKLDPAMMFQDLHRSLEQFSISGNCNLKYQRMPDYYLFKCFISYTFTDEICFEVELCKIWMLKLYGLKVTKIKGDEHKYQEIIKQIIENLGWNST